MDTTGMDQDTLPVLLLLADGRFPSGGHAHSGGLEPASALQGVSDVDMVAEFLRGRLATTGLVGAAFAAAACTALQQANGSPMAALSVLDGEFAARTPSPGLRTASRRLGRQLLRVGRVVWPHPHLPGPSDGAYQPVALGAVAAAGGLGPAAAAFVVAHESVLGPATAAVRLLGLDPFAVHALVASLSSAIGSVADRATAAARAAPADLPSAAGPLLETSAECHATWEVRLFAS